MKVSKKIKLNKFKPQSSEARSYKAVVYKGGSLISIDFCLKCIMTIAFLSVLSLACIFAYDFITQSKILHIKKIKISGIEQKFKKEILDLAELNCDKNIFKVNLFNAEKLIESHPWVKSSTLQRNISCELIISIIKENPLAIVKIENLTDILINAEGKPFKEYNSQKDSVNNLPVITGIDLTKPEYNYMFQGHLFDSILEFLKSNNQNSVKLIKADKNRGITVETNDIYNKSPLNHEKTIQIKLGFNKYQAKLNKAIKISEYIDKNFPERTISTIDLFDIEKVFIKTKSDRLLLKGV